MGDGRGPRRRGDLWRPGIVERGAVYDVDWPEVGVHPGVVVTRRVALPFLPNVTVALITTTVRGLPTEVPVGQQHGLDHESVINCDNLATIRKNRLIRYRGRVGPAEVVRLKEALRIALELD